MILPSCKNPPKNLRKKPPFNPPKKPPEKTAEPLAVRLDRGELDSTDGASDKANTVPSGAGPGHLRNQRLWLVAGGVVPLAVEKWVRSSGHGALLGDD